jgi:hypothetical protein
MKDEHLIRLAEQAARDAGVRVGKKRRLRVVGAEPPPSLSALQRDVLYSRIKDLGNLYALNWLIRQETMHVLGVMECLSDDELTELLAKMERGLEARMDGVAFEEVGLVRGATCNWVA